MSLENQKKEVITEKIITILKYVFKDEEAYRYHLRNLWQTRQGFIHIMETNPMLKEQIKPQFHTINELIGTLLNFDFPHPVYD